jgi:peptidoglycan/LPS O-acetylase OafA/YrhL
MPKETVKGRIAALDGLRTLAIILVFNTHFFGYFFNRNYFGDSATGQAVALLRNGDIGVDLFFVISGYLMFKILGSGRESSAGYFFARRVLRLMPAHLVVLVVLLLGPFSASDFLLNATFLAPLVPGAKLINPVTWSLTVEALFYVVIFCTFKAAHSRVGDWGVIAGTALVICGAALAGPLVAPHLGSETLAVIALRVSAYLDPGRTLGFVIGMALPMLAIDAGRARTPLWLLLWAGVGALMLARWHFGDGFLHMRFQAGYFIVAALLFGGIVLLALQGAGARLLGSAPVQYLGKLSYSFYLIHYALCENIHLFFPGIKTAADLALAYGGIFGMTVLLSAVVYAHIERPYMEKWRQGGMAVRPLGAPIAR